MSSEPFDRRVDWKPKQRPEWVARLNEEGHILDIEGIVPLGETSLLDAARANTGLDDFGEDGWRDHFRALLSAIESEAKLNFMGRILTRSDLLLYLEARLQVTDWYKQHPETDDEVIAAPVFIVGFGRSGTTIFHEVLSQDPQFRVVQRWEALFPCPPPETATYETDPRIEKADRLITLTNRITPEYQTMHAVGGDLPVEDIEFTYLSFLSEVYYCAFQIPSYVEYFHSHDIAYTFGWHKRMLKLLQSRHRKAHWLLKAPTHIRVLPKLLETYPDARLVFMHRDPVVVADSTTNIQGTIYWWRTDDPWSGNMLTGHLMVEGRVKAWDRVIGWMEDGTLPPGSWANVIYREFSEDPIPAIEKCYRDLGLKLTSESRDSMAAYLKKKPKGVYGEHRYEAGAGQASVVAEERKHFARYQKYFGVPSEA